MSVIPTHIEIDGDVQPKYTQLLTDKAALATAQAALSGYAAEPTKPNYVNTEATWDDYNTAYNAWFNGRAVLENTVNTLNLSIPTQKEVIRQLLPVHTWVKVINIDPSPSPRYIGWHTSIADPDYVPYLMDVAFSDPTPDPLVDGPHAMDP